MLVRLKMRIQESVVFVGARRGKVDRCVGKIKMMKCTRERNIERANEWALMLMQLLLA